MYTMIKFNLYGRGCSSVVEYLASMHKALGSIPGVEVQRGKVSSCLCSNIYSPAHLGAVLVSSLLVSYTAVV